MEPISIDEYNRTKEETENKPLFLQIISALFLITMIILLGAAFNMFLLPVK